MRWKYEALGTASMEIACARAIRAPPFATIAVIRARLPPVVARSPRGAVVIVIVLVLLDVAVDDEGDRRESSDGEHEEGREGDRPPLDEAEWRSAGRQRSRVGR